MNRRIARKIDKAVRRGPCRWSRFQVARAALRVYRSPLLVTSATAAWTPGTMGDPGHIMLGRAMLISGRCMILEQRMGLFDWVRRDERIYFERRP